VNIGIGTARRPTNLAASQHNNKGSDPMFSSVMKAFDRAALSIFMVLAITPMLAVAVSASIH